MYSLLYIIILFQANMTEGRFSASLFVFFSLNTPIEKVSPSTDDTISDFRASPVAGFLHKCSFEPSIVTLYLSTLPNLLESADPGFLVNAFL